jgi:hypothetical protein
MFPTVRNSAGIIGSAPETMTPIYHITHAQNLPGIMTAGGLWCDSVRATKVAAGAAVVGIAHQHIKERRARKAVMVAARGTLADYVPFYFAPRSPMLFTISRGNVAGYTGGQEQVVHLVSTVERACGLGSPWCFTDGHADMALSKQYSDLKDLPKIDWAMMKEVYWNDTMADGDRKRKRQAEFLFSKMFPWSAVVEIGVMTERVAAAVRGALTGAKHAPKVVVQRSWYY